MYIFATQRFVSNMLKEMGRVCFRGPGSEQNSGPEAFCGLQWARAPELQIKAHKTL